MVHFTGRSINTSLQYGFTKSSVVIIGGGFSGICMAIKLLEDGIRDFVILEKSTGFGGTWKDNAYPGCCCDVLSILYCFSFEQNPDWSRLYPEQEEILNYVNGIARKYDLFKYVRFGSEVTRAKWKSDRRTWEVGVRVIAPIESEACDSYKIETNFLVAGTGQLNQPRFPNIPGREDFEGKVMHSARWDWSYDLVGKRVGIIGNGATAVQVVPELANVAEHLTVFQRTPNWVVPRMNEDVPEWKRKLLRHVPFLMTRARALVMDGQEKLFEGFIERDSKTANDLIDLSRELMHTQLPDRPDLWEKLTPNYAPGCKRMLITDDYYPALCRPNVHLETSRIQEITPTGVRVKRDPGDDGSEYIDFDVLVFATGFQSNDFLYGIDLEGVGDQNLRENWSKGAAALYGVSADGMPNFGMLYGPNTNLGHNSILLMIEAQARYIRTLVKEVLKSRQLGKAVSIRARPTRVQEYNEKLQQDLKKSSFADPQCNSWYKTAAGLITNNWSGTVIDYQKLLSKVDWGDYEILGKEVTSMPQGQTWIGRVQEETIIGPKSMTAVAILGTVAAGGAFLYRRYRK